MAEIEWAAGLFDGEGSTSLSYIGHKYPQCRMQVGQAGVTIPEVLTRFQGAVCIGKIYGPSKAAKEGFWTWQIHRFEDIKFVFELLKPHLCTPKREQAEYCIYMYENERSL